MRFYLPYVETLTPAATRFLRIARLMGSDCVSIPMVAASSDPVRDLEQAITGQAACIALSPDALRPWLESEAAFSALVSFISTRFQFILIHELDANTTSDRLLRAFSCGIFQQVREPLDRAAKYRVGTAAICGQFSGLEFGSSGPSDRVLAGAADSPLAESIVSIGDAPIFARVKLTASELFILGGVASGKAEFDVDLGGEEIAGYFREVVPLAMFLRLALGDQCWRPANPPGATFILDDPPLWKRYGFLNYAKLMAMMDRFNFHTCIAFIPYYWKRTVASTELRFKERPDRLSVCFHGNDHTEAEFASRDTETLNSIIATATNRMESFTRRTGIPCARVIVFPQGKFSRAALRVLKEHGFVAAVNTGHSPREEKALLTLTDLLQPAVLSQDAVPLFLRRYVKDCRPEGIAWNAFWGRPILIVEHHGIFKDPSPLFDLVSTINHMLPNVQWMDLGSAVANACLKRTAEDGSLQILPFALTGRIANPETSPLRCVLEWPFPVEEANAQVALSSGAAAIEGKDQSTSGVFSVAPESVGMIALQRRALPRLAVAAKPSLKREIRVKLRRCLSEFRDNYLSKSPATMSLVKFLRQQLR